MPNTRMQDPEHLKSTAYKTADRLNARIAFWQQYGEPRDEAFGSFYDAMADQSQPELNTRVLEVGCGPGHLWQWGLENNRIPAGWSMTLTDLSEGMLEDAKQKLSSHPARFVFQAANVCDLEFENESFDIVIANYMLYHAPDLDKAISEISRVLKPGGKLFAKTNSGKHIVEFLDLQSKFAINDDERKKIGLAHDAFTLENGGAVISRHFANVEIQNDSSICEAKDPELVANFLLSMDAQVDIETAREHIENEIADNGYFKVTRSSGMFIATK